MGKDVDVNAAVANIVGGISLTIATGKKMQQREIYKKFQYHVNLICTSSETKRERERKEEKEHPHMPDMPFQNRASRKCNKPS